MNIMFDFDSTLVLNPIVIDTLIENLPFDEAYDIIHNLHKDYTNYVGIPSHIKDMMDAKFSDGLLMTSLSPNTYAQSVVQDLVDQGHSVYVITARGSHEGEVKETTPAFVKELFPMVKGIALTGHNKNKAIKQLDIDIVVEDSITVVDHILDSTEINPAILLLSNENTPWNWKYERSNDILTIDTLLEIPFMVEEYAKNLI